MKKIDVQIGIPRQSEGLKAYLLEGLKDQRSHGEIVIEEADVDDATVQIEIPEGGGMTDVATGKDIAGPATFEGIQSEVSRLEREWKKEG
jgi:hypothetical protein